MIHRKFSIIGAVTLMAAFVITTIVVKKMTSNKRLIIGILSITVITLLIFATITPVQGASIFDIGKVNDLEKYTNRVTSKIDITATLMNSCVDLDDRLSACVKFFKNEDRHLSLLMKESSAEVNKIMGFDVDVNATNTNTNTESDN